MSEQEQISILDEEQKAWIKGELQQNAPQGSHLYIVHRDQSEQDGQIIDVLDIFHMDEYGLPWSLSAQLSALLGWQTTTHEATDSLGLCYVEAPTIPVRAALGPIIGQAIWEKKDAYVVHWMD